MPTRRAVLLGGAGVVTAGLAGVGYGVEQGVLPGRPWLQAHLGLNGPDGVIPDIEPGPVIEESFVSQARGGIEVGWSLILPPGTSQVALPVVVALHWLGADHTTLTGPQLGLDRYLAQHVADGGRPLAIAAPDGGRGYWHPHDGDDAGAMVLDELLPLLDQRGYDTTSASFMGWSMGGYGALRWPGSAGTGPARCSQRAPPSGRTPPTPHRRASTTSASTTATASSTARSSSGTSRSGSTSARVTRSTPT